MDIPAVSGKLAVSQLSVTYLVRYGKYVPRFSYYGIHFPQGSWNELAKHEKLNRATMFVVKKPELRRIQLLVTKVCITLSDIYDGIFLREQLTAKNRWQDKKYVFEEFAKLRALLTLAPTRFTHHLYALYAHACLHAYAPNPSLILAFRAVRLSYH